jgi:hypothetical protein
MIASVRSRAWPVKPTSHGVLDFHDRLMDLSCSLTRLPVTVQPLPCSRIAPACIHNSFKTIDIGKDDGRWLRKRFIDALTMVMHSETVIDRFTPGSARACPGPVHPKTGDEIHRSSHTHRTGVLCHLGNWSIHVEFLG